MAARNRNGDPSNGTRSKTGTGSKAPKRYLTPQQRYNREAIQCRIWVKGAHPLVFASIVAKVQRARPRVRAVYKQKSKLTEAAD